MRVWTIQARPGGPPEAPDIVLVKEGFSWPALVFGPFWFAWKGVWRGLFAYVAASLVLGLPVLLLGLGEASETVVTLAVSVLFAAQANDMLRAALARRGYSFAGITHGRRVLAEQGVLDHWPPHRLIPGAP